VNGPGSGAQDGPVVALPFPTDRLDQTLEELGLDLLVVTSKHNIRYLLGGRHHSFFDVNDASAPAAISPFCSIGGGGPIAPATSPTGMRRI
jgi:Xaa-Pro dipeptidase